MTCNKSNMSACNNEMAPLLGAKIAGFSQVRSRWENVLPSTEYRWLHEYNEFWLLATNQTNNRKIHALHYFNRLRSMEQFLFQMINESSSVSSSCTNIRENGKLPRRSASNNGIPKCRKSSGRASPGTYAPAYWWGNVATCRINRTE